ncbi:hypothetical protein SISNIDRAFT_497611 [Sistotremastrum niveocremeum HHB9708]|uniref:Uncharacterized protein n=1 Tax=Sistotremastrum niveocremeum HHB9708 TaxID=1314777 RepID=A0A164Q1Z4_9AGAM|nr:hypothetical protein SISNIDRAFT_497611 [Sistotremastrum niveocremeum HHB9708]
MTKSWVQTLSIAVCIANSLWLAHTGYLYIKHSRSDVYTYVGSDYPHQLYPTLPSRSTLFPDEDYLPVLGDGLSQDELDDLDYRWKAFSPLPDTGYFHLGELKRPLDLPMYHQLHCIWAMRKGLADFSWHHMNDGHMHHCLNYMRQSILCHADTTLEPFDLVGLENGLVEHGSPVPYERTCRDWKFVSQQSSKNSEEMHAFAVEHNLPPLDGGIDPANDDGVPVIMPGSKHHSAPSYR